MKTGFIPSLFLIFCMAALAGCGGGASGSAATTSISGVASKGIFVSGKVKVFALNSDGSKGTLLDTATIDSHGGYASKVFHSGAVIAEASGSYVDEATGGTIVVPEDTPLRAVLQKAEGEVTMAITPLTEIAVKKVEDLASKKFAVTSIDATNKLIAETFHVADIIATLPADATAPSAEATTAQKEYALTLAAVSQMMADPANSGKSLDQVINRMKDAITVSEGGATFEAQAAADFQKALCDFARSDRNGTDIKDPTSTSLINIGGSTATISLKSQGSGAVLGGIQLTLTLPAGVTIKAANGFPLSGMVALSGVAPAEAVLASHYLASTTGPSRLAIALASTGGFGAGEFLTIRCDVAPGVSIDSTSFTAASYADYKPVDLTGTSVLDLYPEIAAEVVIP